MSYYGNYLTPTFANVFPNFDTFKTFYETCGVPQVLQSGSDYVTCDLHAIYFLLLSRFANSHIMASDTNRFKLETMSILYDAGPVWQREMMMRNKLINLAEADITKGSKSINNHASHPGTAPTTDTLTELQYIDDQNTSTYIKDKIRSYSEAVASLDAGICERFIARFSRLFIKVLYSGIPLLYESEATEND